MPWLPPPACSAQCWMDMPRSEDGVRFWLSRFPGPDRCVSEMTPATRHGSCTPSFGRRFHGAGSAADPSPASSDSPIPGGWSRPALCRRRRSGRIPRGSGRWAAALGLRGLRRRRGILRLI